MAGTQANTGQWFEPETPYATIKGEPIKPRDNASKSTVYPFNKVTETESGHIVEFDDTPGAERIHIYHRSGSFFEFHPNGDKVDKIVRDYYLSILGYAIEPYAQDISVEYPKNQGVFSLTKNEWIAKPEFVGNDMLKDPYLKKKVSFYMHTIDDMIKNKMDSTAFHNLKEKLREMRGAAIKKGGEFSFENLVFKELRNRGYLEKMSNYEKAQQDQSLSL